jgi:ABC-type branched-subunit amino acid transport system ATPase component
MMAPILHIDGVGVRFGGVVALDSLSFAVERNAIHALIGPNGSGKTTLLNSISGAYRPDRGSIALDGAELIGRAPHEIAQHGLARTFQNIRLFSTLTVLENVMTARPPPGPRMFANVVLGTRAARTHEAAVHEHALRALARVGLDQLADRPASTLPYARQRLLEIARALAREPKLMLLDEPAAGMNMTEARELMRLVRSIRDDGITVLLVEHNMRLVMDISERITVLDFGRKVGEGTPEEVRNDPQVIRAYLGTGRKRARG